MPTTVTNLTHALRLNLADAGGHLALGHTHQLVAAAPGYTSLAARQASHDSANLTSSTHWIVDVGQLEERAVSLGLTIDSGVFVHELAKAARDCDGPCVHKSDLEDEFLGDAQEEAFNDHDVASQMADTNTTGPWEANLEFSDATVLPLEVGDAFAINYVGQVQGE